MYVCAAVWCCAPSVALGKLNDGVVTYDAEGEVELDLEKVNYESLMVVSRGGAGGQLQCMGVACCCCCWWWCSSHAAQLGLTTSCQDACWLVCPDKWASVSHPLKSSCSCFGYLEGLLGFNMHVCVLCACQVDGYIREVMGMPPREPEPAAGRGGAAAGGAAAAVPTASDDPQSRSAVKAVQVREAGPRTAPSGAD